MGSYHDRQIADLVLLLCELEFFSKNDTSELSILGRYIDDGFMLTNTPSLDQLGKYVPFLTPLKFQSREPLIATQLLITSSDEIVQSKLVQQTCLPFITLLRICFVFPTAAFVSPPKISSNTTIDGGNVRTQSYH